MEVAGKKEEKEKQTSWRDGTPHPVPLPHQLTPSFLHLASSLCMGAVRPMSSPQWLCSSYSLSAQPKTVWAGAVSLNQPVKLFHSSSWFSYCFRSLASRLSAFAPHFHLVFSLAPKPLLFCSLSSFLEGPFCFFTYDSWWCLKGR